MKTKSELIKQVIETSSVPRRDVLRVFDAIMEVTVQNLKDEGVCILPGDIGKLEIVERSARMGRNPRTGEAVSIPPGKTVKLRASSTLKDQIK